MDYNWFAGFFSGDGCFYVSIRNNNERYKVSLEIQIGQHIKDEFLIKGLVNIFKTGDIYKNQHKNFINYKIGNFEDIYHKMIPLFNQYKIRGVKLLDYQDFCEVAKIIKAKDHLNSEGLKKIQLIKSRMNRARY